jgi:tetratricopeptide (TPR) repeat protein
LLSHKFSQKARMSLREVLKLRKQGLHEQARQLAARLATSEPDDAFVQHEAASVHDFLGLEASAVPYYLCAIDLGLPAPHLRSAYLGLGSTYRVLGRYSDALSVFDKALARFPGANELVVFKAMVEFNMGSSKRALETLLRVIAETSTDPHVRAYRKAIAFYARDIECVKSPSNLSGRGNGGVRV